VRRCEKFGRHELASQLGGPGAPRGQDSHGDAHARELSTDMTEPPEVSALSVARAGATVRGTVPLDAPEPPIGRGEDAP